MNPPSFWLVASFTLWVLGVAAAATRALGWRRGAGPVVAWLVLTGALAYAGALSDFSVFPPALLKLVLPTLVATALVCSSSLAGDWLARWSLAGLVGFQTFRLPLELIMHQAAREGVMPPQMTFTGSNWDILSGLLAVPLALGLARGSVPRALVWLWNGLGLGLLVNVVGVAVLSMPGPMRIFLNAPANTWVTTFPFVWLPTVLVPLALAGHVLVTRKLLARPG